MQKLDPEQVELADLANRLIACLGSSRVEGFVVGRTRLRDAVVSILACSELEAEELVDTMTMRGFLRFSSCGGYATNGEWSVDGRG